MLNGPLLVHLGADLQIDASQYSVLQSTTKKKIKNSMFNFDPNNTAHKVHLKKKLGSNQLMIFQ